MKKVKMTRVSIPESEYLSIKKTMREYNDKHFSQYLERLHNILQCSYILLADKENEISGLLKQIQDLKEYNSRLERIREELFTANDNFQMALDRVKSELSDANRIIDSKNTEIKDLNKQIDALNERLESVCFHNERLSDLEEVLCRRIDDMKCWKGRILNIFGWELFQTPFKRSCKKSKK